MSFAASVGLFRALFLGLVIGAAPALAQQITGKAKNDKVKVKTTGTRAAPQPTSPVASAPQTVLPAPALDAAAGWFADLGAAQARARATNRPILAVFSGSDWCKPCVVYEQEVFARPEFVAYAKDKLVLAHFDYPQQPRNQPTAAQRQLNDAAKAQLNREGDFPLAVLVSPEGRVLAKTGYIAGGPAAFEAYLKTVVPTL